MLTGEKVHLRAPTEGDLGALYEIAADLGTWEQRTPAAPRPVSRSQFAERYAKEIAESGDDVGFVVEVAGAVIGRCSLMRFDPLAHHAEVGISLAASACGKGHGTDALRVLVRFAFERRNLHRLGLGVLASNAAAIACYRKAGFVEEGRRREQAWVRGSYQDEVVMGLLRSEWASSVGDLG